MNAPAPDVPAAVVAAVSIHQFVVEASDLGWRPGRWPPVVTTDLGNCQPLYLAGAPSERSGAVYRQHLGCISVRVLND